VHSLPGVSQERVGTPVKVASDPHINSRIAHPKLAFWILIKNWYAHEGTINLRESRVELPGRLVATLEHPKSNQDRFWF
jgi:hypothetical protein